ncbi:MAG: fumarylacetoacetate hydrolase family protein [Bifidobacterium sp.]|nr:fumarylacetoacetate hydrolase family protein [Bifidobacterium sp.]
MNANTEDHHVLPPAKIGRVLWNGRPRLVHLDAVYAAHNPLSTDAAIPEPTGGELLDPTLRDVSDLFGHIYADSLSDDLDANLAATTCAYDSEDPRTAHRLEVALNAVRTGERIAVDHSDLLAPVDPGKIICVGLNFAKHIEEMGHPRPDVPTLFAKFRDAITDPFKQVTLPAGAGEKLDYEGEYAIVIGRTAWQVDPAEAAKCIAGEMIMNDFTQRDRQYATEQWLQGKTLQGCSGMGPWVTLSDDGRFSLDGWAEREQRVLRTWVNGELRQEASLGDLVFPPAALVSYISQFVTLNAGDVISTGTPAGVGHGRGVYLRSGDTVRIAIDGLGAIENTYVAAS